MAARISGFEKGTLAATLATGDAGDPSVFDNVTIGGSGALIYDNAHVAHGALATKVSVISGASAYFRWDTIGTLTNHFARGYYYFTANPPASQNAFLLNPLNAAGTTVAVVFVNQTGQIVLQDSVGTATTMTNTIPLNQWFRLEANFIHSATVGQIETKLYLTMDSLTADETKTTAANLNTGVNATRMRIGQPSATATYSFWLDNIVSGVAAYPGPFPATSLGESSLRRLRRSGGAAGAHLLRSHSGFSSL